MTKIEIAVAYHKNSEFIKNDCLLPIQVGRVCSDIELNMQGDDSGDNISEKNFGYAELTAIYWLWKNSDADIKGLFHYRRFLDLSANKPKVADWYEYKLSDAFSPQVFLKDIGIERNNIISLLEKYSIVTRRKEDLRSWSNYTVKSHYVAEHHADHLEKALKIIENDYPDYYPSANKLINGYESYFTNMFIMPNKQYDEYCSWLFDILFKIEKTINLYDKTLAPATTKARWAGFLGERLTAIYIQKQIDEGKKVGEFPAVILTQSDKKWFECNTYDNSLYNQKEAQSRKVTIYNNENPKYPIISVCIAAYNVEKYIEHCITSVCTQTLQNIEIIVVNDGSKDNTLSIIHRMANKDKRIKVVDQENQGLGIVRNVGVKRCKGKYVHFLDGDDWIDKSFLEKMVKNAEKNHSDLVISNHVCFEDATGKELYRSTLPHTFYGHGKNIENLADLLMEPCHVWDKIYKRALIQNIIFPSRSSGEDIPFWYQVLLSAKSVSFVREPLYHYRMNPNSVQTKVENVINCFNNIKLAENLILKQPDWVKQYFEIFKQTLVGHMLYRARVALAKNKKFRKEFYSLSKDFLNKNSVCLSESMKLKREWYYCDFDLMDKIRDCNSFTKFEKIIGTESSQKLIFRLCRYYIKKMFYGPQRAARYQQKINDILNRIVFPVKFKFFNLTIAKIHHQQGKTKIYLLGIPFLKRKIAGVYTKYYFLGLPVITKNKIKTKFIGITIKDHMDEYLIQTFDYLGWKINDVYQGCFDDIGYHLHDVLPEKLEEIKKKLK